MRDNKKHNEEWRNGMNWEFQGQGILSTTIALAGALPSACENRVKDQGIGPVALDGNLVIHV